MKAPLVKRSTGADMEPPIWARNRLISILSLVRDAECQNKKVIDSSSCYRRRLRRYPR